MDHEVWILPGILQTNKESPLPKAGADNISRIINADQKWAVKNSRVDLCYLASTWAPYCDEEALRMMVDWNHWVRSTLVNFKN